MWRARKGVQQARKGVQREKCTRGTGPAAVVALLGVLCQQVRPLGLLR
eukprot:CAMPEP_0179103068 /NCGR_PEP_ID=MMETSP0796-20121207/47736_1 /TAXON_ID=73915 /ORGANISM="Pyrodinium bahamense, Strain pbaha01" /LENGTH=47 /DNA_ID= /DNA_START= /DNA_END= /DNA_ORIENTATION=